MRLLLMGWAYKVSFLSMLLTFGISEKCNINYVHKIKLPPALYNVCFLSILFVFKLALLFKYVASFFNHFLL